VKTATAMRTRKGLSHDTLERIRHATQLSESQWQDLLQVTWWDYTLIRTGERKLSESALLRISDHILCAPEQIISGQVDYHGLQMRTDQKSSWEMPEPYSYAQYGRRRTTITTFEYIERYHGWKMRSDVLKHLGLSESILQDPFAPISMRVITDALAYLAKRQFKARDFFGMGLYTYIGNAKTILGEHYGQMSSPKEVIENMWSDCLNFYEQNCRYRFLKLSDQGAVIEVVSEKHVAEEMGVKHLGNEHVCQLKAGMMASAPMYMWQAPAQVVELCCAHKGAQACVFEVSFISFGVV
jgi:predicted hydrocarbon binding protein